MLNLRHTLLLVVIALIVPTTCNAVKIILETTENVDLKVSKQIHTQLEYLTVAEKKVPVGIGELEFKIPNGGYYVVSVNNSSELYYFDPNNTYKLKYTLSSNITMEGSRLNNALKNLRIVYKDFKYNNKSYFEWETNDFMEGISALEKKLFGIISTEYVNFTTDEKEVLEQSTTNALDAQILNFAWSRFNPNQPNPPILPDFYAKRISSVSYSKDQLSQNNESYLIAIVTKRNWEVNQILKEERSKKSKFDYNDFLRVVYQETLDDKAMEAELKSFHIASMFIDVLRAPNVEKLDSYINNYIQSFPNSIYYKILNERFTKKMVLEDEKLLFDMPILDTQKLAKSLIKEYENKVIYLDLWATWCGPCIKSFPAYNELSKKYTSQRDQIAFVKLSIDQDFDKWKSFRLEDANDSYILPADERNTIMSNYQIYSVPRYIIINKDGSINRPIAPSPNNPSISEVLDEVLNQ